MRITFVSFVYYGILRVILLNNINLNKISVFVGNTSWLIIPLCYYVVISYSKICSSNIKKRNCIKGCFVLKIMY